MDYKIIAIRLSSLFDENELLNKQIIDRKTKEILDLEYRLKVAESKLSQIRKLLAESERQRCKALQLLDTNQYRI